MRTEGRNVIPFVPLASMWTRSRVPVLGTPLMERMNGFQLAYESKSVRIAHTFSAPA